MPEKNNKEKEYFDNLVKQIKKIPISKILSEHGVKFEQSSGSNLLALCPFHMDERIGSFSANDDMGICKCFACGEGGNSIRFIQKTQNLSFAQAVIQLAADENLIPKDEYERRMKKKYSDEFIRNMENQYSPAQKAAPKVLSEEETNIRNDIYGAMKEYFGLSEEHRSHLKNVRKLSDEQIERDYFSFFSEKKSQKRKLIKHLLERFPQYRETLKDVPGFFQEKEFSVPTLCNYSGIGILIRNASGLITGIQIRKDLKKEGECRYVWFSSSFAKGNKLYLGGNGTGSPVDILYPQKEKKNPCFCIAEGKFKTEILSQQGNIAMSVQGVGNFAGCEKEIAAVQKKMGKEFNNFYIYYDADMLRNMAVYAQAVKLGEYLIQHFPSAEVKYNIWNDADGKGIDDLYFNHGKDGIKSIRIYDYKTIRSTWEQTVTSLMSFYGIEQINKIPKEIREEFLDDLERILKKKFKISGRL